jgi:DNA-directed RNA polymerase subunit RPC12/RpoP
MSKPIVRCRCGHQVLAKEVLRTDLYERRASEGSSREYVYVKYRCQRCKRMGEAFVPESRWDRSILEPAQNEMNDTSAISSWMKRRFRTTKSSISTSACKTLPI